MELRQLEYLLAVSEEASFTKAAARLHVAQPGVSAQIRQLERELGQTLLDRSGRSVRPTDVGAAVLPYARAALRAVAGVRLAVDELAGLVRGHVAVGMVTSCLSLVDLPLLLADFHRHHPDVEITLTEANSDRLLDWLRDGELDVAVVGAVGRARRWIATHAAADEALVAAVSHDDPLAACAEITLTALRERALISLPRGTGLRASIDGACSQAGFQPHIAFEASDPNVLARFAARGFGVAILPASIARAHPADLHPIAITSPRLRARLELAWRAEGPTSPAARALVAHTVAALEAAMVAGPGDAR
jgi:DNA-binding transcriptional LysR family regulator